MAKARNPRVGSDPISQEGRNTTYPELCRKCAVRDGRAVHDRCDFCVDLAFDEGNLCDLTRSVQDCDKFGCYAFRPVSRQRPSPIKSVEDMPHDRKRRITFDDNALLSSDRFKYQQALAVQRIRNDPDSVNVNLKYHVAWNVACRRPVFSSLPTPVVSSITPFPSAVSRSAALPVCYGWLRIMSTYTWNQMERNQSRR